MLTTVAMLTQVMRLRMVAGPRPRPGARKEKKEDLEKERNHTESVG